MSTKSRGSLDEEALEDYRDGLSATIDYFSSKNKAAREAWTCHEFLRNLGVRYRKDEVTAPASDPPDAIFRSAAFEIKEVLDPGRRRHAEYKQSLQRALQAKSTDDIYSLFAPKDLTASDVLVRVEEVLKAYSSHYPSEVKSGLDLLVYVNLIEHFFKDSAMPSASHLGQFGWRSISAITGSHALVFHAAPGAPRFLAIRRGQLAHRKR